MWKQSQKRRQTLQTQKAERLVWKTLIILSLGLSLIFAPPLLQAQPANNHFQTDSLVAEYSIPIEEIRVQAFRYAQDLVKAPGAIAIIPANQLEEVPAQQIDFTLNQVAGVYMQSGSLNTSRLTIRGIGGRSPYASNKVRAYFEDIPLTNGTGETSLEDLDQQLIDNIEVIKGPASGFYGSGLGGTLLLHAPPVNRNAFGAETSFASYNQRNYRANIQLTAGEWSNGLYVNRLKSDGYRENNETNRTNLSYAGQYDAGNHQFNLILIQTDMKAYIPSSLDWEDFQNNPRQAAANWAEVRGYEDYQKQMAGLSVQSDWGNNYSSRISIFGQRKAAEELRPFNFLEEDTNYKGFRLIAEKKWYFPKSEFGLSFGNESFWENYDWQTSETDDHNFQLSDNAEKRKYFNFFSQLNYTSNKLRVSTGINLNQTKYDYRDHFLSDGNQSADHRFNPIVSPRLALSYSLTGHASLYGNISHGFSPPSLEETLTPDGQRNTDIKPETGWNTEIGSRGTIAYRLFYDLSFYYMEIKNLLVARRTAEDAYMGVNAGKTRHPGVELALNYRWLNQARLMSAFRFAGNYSPYKFNEFIDGENDYSGNDLTGSPKTRLNIVSDTHFRNLQLLVQFQYTGEIPLRDDNSIYTDAYQLVNLTLSYQKRWDNLELNVTTSALNLTDEHYASMVLINASSFGNQSPRYYYPGLPRNFAGSIRLKYLF
ncbi:TonB-dependent receptor [Mangrovibacterium diazotrophicum]|uniref:Iron complex outermembrane receptor protein n=1 Tax=Mangrovibacterium diazotrophicum TaxID=1261403 RepID=A0A419W5T7_9BACT|nr:TonB-dependent receptor [Mangrovibacterium diazotrophicum]RKD90812.1 iron complex outermembrane receptor protein [Mangrovibacterium diazotrophicum]